MTLGQVKPGQATLGKVTPGKIVREGENGLTYPQVNHWFVCLRFKYPIVF